MTGDVNECIRLLAFYRPIQPQFHSVSVFLPQIKKEDAVSLMHKPLCISIPLRC